MFLYMTKSRWMILNPRNARIISSHGTPRLVIFDPCIFLVSNKVIVQNQGILENGCIHCIVYLLHCIVFIYYILFFQLDPTK